MNPTNPLNAAGILTDPNISFPKPRGEILAPTIAPSPPELPPADLSLFQGFKQRPHKKLKESKFSVICGMFVFTNGIIPLFLAHSIIPQSSSIILLALAVNPIVERVPLRSMLSLIETGIPKSGGRYF